MTRTKKTIKAELRAERGKEHPDEGHLSELLAELERARGGRPRRRRGETLGKVSADQDANRRLDPDHRPVMIGNDDVSGWPPELRRRARGGRFL
jgi:hypothetical protein